MIKCRHRYEINPRYGSLRDQPLSTMWIPHIKEQTKNQAAVVLYPDMELQYIPIVA